MEFKESEQFEGMLSLFEDDEDGHPEERYTFLNSDVAQDYINRLQRALDKVKNKKTKKTRGIRDNGL